MREKILRDHMMENGYYGKEPPGMLGCLTYLLILLLFVYIIFTS